MVLLAACVAGSACSSAAASGASLPLQSAVAQWDEHKDLARFFGGADGTFVLFDAQTGRTVGYNRERARIRFLPASTYKVPNTLIALETGVAGGPGFELAWDSGLAPPQPWWPAAWARDHTLRTALQNSVVWYYQELARRIGAERMQAYLSRFKYGNQDISGGIDRFWLTGGLRVSAEEQVEFLKRFYFNQLQLSERVVRVAKELLVMEETPSYRLSGKTGWAGLGDPSADQVGWLIGYVERGESVHFFAMNMEILDQDHAAARRSITKAILSDVGVIRED
jgi:beta-lactamase class D